MGRWWRIAVGSGADDDERQRERCERCSPSICLRQRAVEIYVRLFATSGLESRGVRALLDLAALNAMFGRFRCIMFTALALDMIKDKKNKSRHDELYISSVESVGHRFLCFFALR